jgi:hypothetical protein
VRAVQHFKELFSPLTPDGRRWCDAQIEDHLAEVRAALSSLPEGCRTRVLGHVERHRARWSAHRVLWDLIGVKLHEGSELSREQLLDAAVALWWSEHRVCAPCSAESAHTSRELWSLCRLVERCCENAAELLSAVASLIE